MKSIKPEIIRKALAEFDKHPHVKMTISQLPQALNVIDHSLSTKKAAISQAYKATEAREAGFLYKEEFPFFLDILFQYTKYEVTFKKLDTDGDHRISYEEFKANRKAAGLEGDLLTGDAKEEFDNLDLDHGGKILFSEFCSYMAKLETAKIHKEFKKSVNTDPNVRLDDLAAFLCRKYI